VIPLSVMSLFRDRIAPLPAGAPLDDSTDQGSDAVEVGSALYQLSLKYWAEGRLHDAERVGLQAVQILRREPRASDLIAGVESTLAEIAHELAAGDKPSPPRGVS
jgi:hypothetical protein